MKEDFQFVSFDVALMAAQVLSFHYAHFGYHVNWSAYNGQYSHSIYVTIFHDELTIINPPAGYQYSSKRSDGKEGSYWTEFTFRVAE